MKSFAEAKAVLARYIPKDIHSAYTLERMIKLMASLGNPQNQLKVIHIAGTSGKTSTAYYAVALLKTSGQKVGLTVSPYVYEINERLQINLKPLAEAEFCRALNDFLKLVKQSGVKPTYFEILVAFAYWYFALNKVDYAVVEVGLGGLLDGTNVVKRADKICVITDIGLDHTEVLGNTLPEIIHQKTGIVQSGNQVFAQPQSPKIIATIKNEVVARGGQLTVVPASSLQSTSLPLFQRRNWRLAKSVFDFTAERDELTRLSPKQLDKAMDISIPARMEILKLGSKTIVLDGAHNAQKMHVLAASLSHQFGTKPMATLLAVKTGGQDFKTRTDLSPICQLSHAMIVTSFKSTQDLVVKSIAPNLVAEHCRKLGGQDIEVINDPKVAFKKLLSRPEPVLLVTGSFYLMSHIKPLLR